MILGLLGVQKYISLVIYESMQLYIEVVHGVPYQSLMCIHGIRLLEHALTMFRMSPYAHTFPSETPPLTAAKLRPRSPLSGFSSQASNGLMPALGGESRRPPLESPDGSKRIRQAYR